MIVTFWMKTKVWGEIVGSLASLVCTPILVASGIAWMSGVGHSASVTSRALSAVHAVPGEISEIEPDIKVDTDATKITYRLRLTDINGHTVYVYPQSEVLDKMPKLTKVMIQVPDQIDKGTYILYTDVTYAKNPIRTGVVSTQVAKIEIDE